MTAAELYEAMVRYLIATGWVREEEGSGWWWKDGFEEAVTGTAVDQQLEADGIDHRTMLANEPKVFWG